MKRLVVLCMFALVSLFSFAEMEYFRAFSLVVAKIENNQYYWSDWSECNVLISFDLDSDIIAIASDVPQAYKVVGVKNNGRPV